MCSKKTHSISSMKYFICTFIRCFRYRAGGKIGLRGHMLEYRSFAAPPCSATSAGNLQIILHMTLKMMQSENSVSYIWKKKQILLQILNGLVFMMTFFSFHVKGNEIGKIEKSLGTQMNKPVCVDLLQDTTVV